MVKLIISNNNNKNSEIGARKTKATYKNNEISEKVTWFDILRITSFSWVTHCQLGVLFYLFLFLFFS